MRTRQSAGNQLSLLENAGAAPRPGLMSPRQASSLLSEKFGRRITVSNISYLVQYGRVARHRGGQRTSLVDIEELVRYYQGLKSSRRARWQQQPDGEINWALSFEDCREADTTKHVHRLHPYKGKFIPQLVAYFLDRHTDEFKKEARFDRGDLVLDPFCGSGTTLVQAAELGIHALGIDVSAFNAFISNVKLRRFDIPACQRAAGDISARLQAGQRRQVDLFDREMATELAAFNRRFFPSPEFKKGLRSGEISEKSYVPAKERQFRRTYEKIVARHGIEVGFAGNGGFIDKWFMPPLVREIELVRQQIGGAPDRDTADLLRLILSRTVRSCRATTHSDLATLARPTNHPYYCPKHGKICRPPMSISNWWKRYAVDTIARLAEFARLRTDSCQLCLAGDARDADLLKMTAKKHPRLHRLLQGQRARGIFSSPPYVGMIDYHEQHSYAYELFGFARNDSREIGALAAGRGKAAREKYVQAMAAVLHNCRRFMVADFDVYLVANDRFDLYTRISELAGMKVVQKFIRPVLNRSERDQGAYSEAIFHLRDRRSKAALEL